MRVDQQGHVLARQRRVEVGPCHALPTAFTDDLIHQRVATTAFLPRAVQVVEHGKSQAAAGGQHRGCQRMRVGCGLAPDGAALAAIPRIGLALPVLHPTVDREGVFITPVLVAAGRGPVLKIVLEGARPDRGVDAAAATHDLAHVLRDGAVVRAARRDRNVLPVAFGSQVGEPDGRVLNGRGGVPITRLEHQNARPGPGRRQPSDQSRACAARADHDVVVCACKLRRALGLVRADGVQFVGQRVQAAACKARGRGGKEEAASVYPTRQKGPFESIQQRVSRD